MNKPYLIAEIGINHNGDLKVAKELIKISKENSFDAVKFQKRTIDVVYDQKTLTLLEKVHGGQLLESKKLDWNLKNQNMMK